MLGSAQIVAFVATKDAEKARAFYVDVLGLRFVSDDQFALVIDANGITVRIAKTRELAPQPFTVLGWEVADIKATVKGLVEKGAVFERWGFMEQDELGIWTAPEVDNASGGALVAWFKDPDGNLLSVSQHRG